MSLAMSQHAHGAAFSPAGKSVHALQSKRDWLKRREQRHDASAAASPHGPIPKIVGGRLGWLREQYLRNKSLVARAEQELIQATLDKYRPAAVLLPEDDDAPLTAAPILFDPKHAADKDLCDALLATADADAAGQCDSGSDEGTTSDEEEVSENEEDETALQQDMNMKRVLPVARPLKTSEFIAQYRPPPVELGKFSPFIEFNPRHAESEAEEHTSDDDDEEDEIRRWGATTPITPTASNFLDELMGRDVGKPKTRGRALQVL